LTSTCLADCNVACQKKAWKNGHKQECTDLKEDRKNGPGTDGMYMPPARTAVSDSKIKEILGAPACLSNAVCNADESVPGKPQKTPSKTGSSTTFKLS
jgi:hypothetical protein